MKKYLVVGLVLGLVISLALNVEGESSTSGAPSVKVYTAGFYKDGDKEVACYWKDTTKIDLPGDDIHNSIASSIFVSDNTVYTAGSIRNNTIACYWKGENRTDLNNDVNEETWAALFMSLEVRYLLEAHTVTVKKRELVIGPTKIEPTSLVMMEKQLQFSSSNRNCNLFDWYIPVYLSHQMYGENRRAVRVENF